MEAVAAFSLAGTVLQFVDSGARFITLAKNLYKHGADNADDHLQLIVIVESLNKVIPKLDYRNDDRSSDCGLGQLAVECGKCATRLLGILETIKEPGTARRRDAMRTALRLICKEDEIKALQGQLSAFRDQLNMHLLLSLREYALKSSIQQEEIIKQLGTANNSNLRVGGIAASILQFLVLRDTGPLETQLYGDSERSRRLEGIKSLRSDLVETIQNADVTEPDRTPFSINLSPKDLEDALAVFLGNLRYDGMVDRESRIATAHESTLHWVFEDIKSAKSSKPHVTWSNLRQWLESHEQLYWITGKAGSGKSTLMKFLCSSETECDGVNNLDRRFEDQKRHEHYRCHPFLINWAGNRNLLVASFYFWNSGMELQVTQDGLFRTLLYQLVAQCPDIMPSLISPKEWEALCLFNELNEHWSTQGLHRMLFEAVEVLSNRSRVCFFIDGLDEFEDNHQSLIDMVKELIEGNSQIKICVASRPWNVFEDALGHEPNLRLEDLTFNDIRHFVQSKFSADREFENLRLRYPPFAEELMDNIVKKAAGVFLWVDLVVSSLLAGMRLGDRIQDFQKRLDELPPDLEKLYEKILYSLEPFYLEHAAQHFALVETAKEPLTLLLFAFADEETPASAIQMLPGSMTGNEIQLRVDAVSRRLNSRCKGLLETDRALHSIQGITTRPAEELTVQYLHRTVRDFIKSPKAQSFLKASMNPNFDTATQLCVAYLMDLKTWKGQERGVHIMDQDPTAVPRVSNLFYFVREAAHVHERNESVIVELLDELKNTVQQPDILSALAKSKPLFEPNSDVQTSLRWGLHGEWRQNSGSSRMIDESFLSLATASGVVAYVKARAEWGGLIHSLAIHNLEEKWPLLFDALSPTIPEPRMIECLLNLGADPNFTTSKVATQSPWLVALTRVTMLYTIQNDAESAEEYLQAQEKWKQTLKLLYSHGADCQNIPASRLSPLSRRLLQEIVGKGVQLRIANGEEGWLTSWTSTIRVGAPWARYIQAYSNRYRSENRN